MLTYRCAGVAGRDDDDRIVRALQAEFPLESSPLARRAQLDIEGPNGEVYRMVVLAEGEVARALLVLRSMKVTVRDETGKPVGR